MSRTILVALAVTIADGNLVPNPKWDADDFQQYVDTHVLDLKVVSVMDRTHPELNCEPQIFAANGTPENSEGDVSCACAPRALAGACVC